MSMASPNTFLVDVKSLSPVEENSKIKTLRGLYLSSIVYRKQKTLHHQKLHFFSSEKHMILAWHRTTRGHKISYPICQLFPQRYPLAHCASTHSPLLVPWIKHHPSLPARVNGCSSFHTLSPWRCTIYY